MVGYFSPKALERYEQEKAKASGSDELVQSEDLYAKANDPNVVRTPASTVEAFASTVSAEDYVMGEHQQRAAASGLLEHSIFGRNEAPLHHFHTSYREALGRPPLEKIT